MARDNKERETHDFMNVESFSQLPFIWSTPKEKGIKLFGIEFGSQNVVNVSSESESGDTIIACEDANRNDDDNNNNNSNNYDESRRRFECHYCCRNFPTSQALGGHQNAHKRERQHAKRAQLQHGIGPFPHAAHVYGLVNYHRLPATAAAPSALPINNYPSWNTNSQSVTTSTAARFYGPLYSTTTPINGSPLTTWRISATRNNVPSFGSRERSLLNPLPLFAGDEKRKGGTAVGGGGSGGSHQTRFVYEHARGSYIPSTGPLSLDHRRRSKISTVLAN